MTPILKALAELEDADERAEEYGKDTSDTALYWVDPWRKAKAYKAGAASMRPAVEAVKVLVEAMEAIEIIGRKLDPVYIETWNAQAALAKEALADAARILGGGK